MAGKVNPAQLHAEGFGDLVVREDRAVGHDLDGAGVVALDGGDGEGPARVAEHHVAVEPSIGAEGDVLGAANVDHGRGHGLGHRLGDLLLGGAGVEALGVAAAPRRRGDEHEDGHDEQGAPPPHGCTSHSTSPIWPRW